MSGNPCLSPATSTLAMMLMSHCGLNGFSKRWHEVVGVPAVSGVGGLLLVSIPNVSALACVCVCTVCACGCCGPE